MKKFGVILVSLLLVFAVTFSACENVENVTPPVLEGQENELSSGDELDKIVPETFDEFNEEDVPFEEESLAESVKFSEPFDLFSEFSAENLHSRSVYLYNITADYPVYALNENERLPPASTLKMMTAIVTLENVENLYEIVEIPEVCFDEFHTGNPNKEGIARLGVEAGQDNFTYLDCLNALLVASCCEISNVLAYNVGGGSIATFVDMMNAKAAELGLENTHFTNPHGLHETGNFSSAHDMFLIAQYAFLNLPMFVKIIEQPAYIYPPLPAYPEGFILQNRCGLSRDSEENLYFFEGAKSVKTGALDYVYEFINGEWVEFDGITCLTSRFVYNDEVFLLSTFHAPWLYGTRPIFDEDGYELSRFHYTYLDHGAIYEAVVGAMNR
ncbi:MAG: hypothetical protein FWH20_07335 [Oscillospiraceae bacterium]|nr:hypothetical protein [Oscillospiraceae bacterium]